MLECTPPPNIKEGIPIQGSVLDMIKLRFRLLLSLLLLLAIGLSASAQIIGKGTAQVDARANIFASGHAKPSDPGGRRPRRAPAGLQIPGGRKQASYLLASRGQGLLLRPRRPFQRP